MARSTFKGRARAHFRRLLEREAAKHTASLQAKAPDDGKPLRITVYGQLRADAYMQAGWSPEVDRAGDEHTLTIARWVV